jgi:PTH1 family peptidyl-tRNA hydrolase
MTWVIVGLGNPGEEYEGTRHNAGRMAVEVFARAHDASEWKTDKLLKARTAKGKLGKSLYLLCEPETYMNESGKAVGKFVAGEKAAAKMVVVYDDLDLPQGSIKVSFNRSAGGHKGLESVIKAVKTPAFARVRIGISPTTPAGKLKKPKGEDEVSDFVLAQFRQSELSKMTPAFKRAAEAIGAIVEAGDVQLAMNTFN